MLEEEEDDRGNIGDGDVRDSDICQRCWKEQRSLQSYRRLSRSRNESDLLGSPITLCQPCHAVVQPDASRQAQAAATLFPRPSAPTAVSLMRTRNDHVCQRCREIILDCENLVAYDVPAEENQTLMLCKPCAGVLYDHDETFAVSALRSNHRFPAHELSGKKYSASHAPHPQADPPADIEWEPSTRTTETQPWETDWQPSDIYPGLDSFISSNIALCTTVSLSLGVVLLLMALTGLTYVSVGGMGSVVLFIVAIASRMNTENMDGGLGRASGIVAIIAVGGVALVAAAGVAIGVAAGGVYLFIHMIAIVVGYTVWSPIVSVTETAMTAPVVTGAIILGGIGLVWVTLLYTSWTTETAINWALTLRMITSMVLLAALTVVFFTAIWRLIEATVWVPTILLGIETGTRQLITNVVGIWLLVAFVYHELDRFDIGKRYKNGIPVTADKYPTLHTTTTRIASQLDIPVPTIIITGRSELETITWGYRPGNMSLVLSRGTLDALDDAELEAVIAHELAHIANMDAIVMTIASLPLLLADGLKDRANQMGVTEDFLDVERDRAWYDLETDAGLIRTVLWVITIIPFLVVFIVIVILSLIFAFLRVGSPHYIVVFVLLVIGGLTKYISLPLISILSRSRESVADRTAATVTGSPAALASALRTLDERIEKAPNEDLREKSLSTMTILPLDPCEEPTKGADENAGPIVRGVTRLMDGAAHVICVLFATHPPTSHRIDVLTDLDATQERET
jgi:heat shock protein HtpX